MRSRVSKSVPVSRIFYIQRMSLTFICFDCWCKMWGFAPNSLSRNGHIVRTRNGHQHEPEMVIITNQKWTHRVYTEMV